MRHPPYFILDDILKILLLTLVLYLWVLMPGPCLLVLLKQLIKREVISVLTGDIIECPLQPLLNNQIFLDHLSILRINNLKVPKLCLIILIQPGMFHGKLMMYPMDLINFILKFQSKTYLLIKWLLCLFEVLGENILLILEVCVLLSEGF